MQARGCQTSYFSILLQLLLARKCHVKSSALAGRSGDVSDQARFRSNIAAIGSVGDRFVRIGLWSKRRLDFVRIMKPMPDRRAAGRRGLALKGEKLDAETHVVDDRGANRGERVFPIGKSIAPGSLRRRPLDHRRWQLTHREQNLPYPQWPHRCDRPARW